MSGFNSSITGDFDKYFMTTTNLIDRYATGGLWSWGDDSSGGLGDNSTTPKSSPVQTVSGGINWKQVSVGNRFSASLKTDGTLWTWGLNSVGQLGDNSITNKSSPVQTIVFGTDWKDIQCSPLYYTTAGIKTDGTLWLWGSNQSGKLGDNTANNTSSPIQTISRGNNWKQVALGDLSTAAIKTDGTLWTWGQNSDFGQLGDNTANNKSSPVQTVAFGTNWKQVSAGYRAMAAIKTDGTLWTWGRNANGELGDNTLTTRSSPVQTVALGTNWKQVSCGQTFTVAIKTDGTLWSWGNNNSGQLGDNTANNKSSPVQTITFGNNWKQVAAGYSHTAAIKTDGTLWTWGINTYGQLGDNSITPKSSPVQTVSGGSNWKQVACGYRSTIAVQYSDIGQVL